MVMHQRLFGTRTIALGVLLAIPFLGAGAHDAAPTTSTGSAMASTSQAGECGAYSATFFGKHITTPIHAWVGSVAVSINGADPEQATFVDQNSGSAPPLNTDGGPAGGTETVTLTFADGATFQIHAQFATVPTADPGLWTLNETGDIVNGTGRFAGISGHVTTHGPFLRPPAFGVRRWIAASTGTVCGI